MPSRRRFLATLPLAGAGLLGGCRIATPHQRGQAGVRVPAGSLRRLLVERFDALNGRSQYVADLGGRLVERPILVARRGEDVDAEIVNRLPQPTTVHFHGMVLPESQDGAGFEVIAPGASRRVHFRVHDRSALYWLHAHVHGLTAEQVHAGLAALFVVTDEDDAALDAALALHEQNRIALALADVRMDSGRIAPYAPTAQDCLTGWLGNHMLANGIADAVFDVQAGWVRMQLLNACNARGLLVALRDGGTSVPFFLLGTDGGLLSHPVALERVFLHPAERIDIAVDVSGQQIVAAESLAFDSRAHAHSAIPEMKHPVRSRYAPLAAAEVCGPGSQESALADGTPLPLFSLRVQAGVGRTAGKLPADLSALPLEDAALPADARIRRFRLDFDERSGFLIDGLPYRIDEIAFRVERGQREVWEIKNSPISMSHPMHLHGPGFRVLRRQGTFGPARALATSSGGRLPTDLGLKDTVTVWPNETVWLATNFALPSEVAFRGAQRYLFHCHNLEHEDGIMMRNFAIV